MAVIRGDSLFGRLTDDFHRKLITQAIVDVSAEGGLTGVAIYFGIHLDTLQNYCKRLEIDVTKHKNESRRLKRVAEHKAAERSQHAMKHHKGVLRSMGVEVVPIAKTAADK